MLLLEISRGVFRSVMNVRSCDWMLGSISTIAMTADTSSLHNELRCDCERQYSPPSADLKWLCESIGMLGVISWRAEVLVPGNRK